MGAKIGIKKKKAGCIVSWSRWLQCLVDDVAGGAVAFWGAVGSLAGLWSSHRKAGAPGCFLQRQKPGSVSRGLRGTRGPKGN